MIRGWMAQWFPFYLFHFAHQRVVDQLDRALARRAHTAPAATHRNSLALEREPSDSIGLLSIMEISDP